MNKRERLRHEFRKYLGQEEYDEFVYALLYDSQINGKLSSWQRGRWEGFCDQHKLRESFGIDELFAIFAPDIVEMAKTYPRFVEAAVAGKCDSVWLRYRGFKQGVKPRDWVEILGLPATLPGPERVRIILDGAAKRLSDLSLAYKSLPPILQSEDMRQCVRLEKEEAQQRFWTRAVVAEVIRARAAAAPELLRVIRERTNYPLCRLAAWCLMLTGAMSAVPELISLVEDKGTLPGVRAAAMESLRRLDKGVAKALAVAILKDKEEWKVMRGVARRTLLGIRLSALSEAAKRVMKFLRLSSIERGFGLKRCNRCGRRLELGALLPGSQMGETVWLTGRELSHVLERMERQPRGCRACMKNYCSRCAFRPSERGRFACPDCGEELGELLSKPVFFRNRAR